MKKYILLGALLFLSVAQAQLIVNNTTFTPIQLVQNSLVGPGVTPYNIMYNGVPGTVIRDQIAKFTTNFNPTNLGLSSGLLLATGNAQLAIGPNNMGTKSQPTATPTQGDPDLALLCGQTVRNVSIVEFDFVATGNELNFDYVFASEEYPEFANSTFNDTFGFFLRGPGITGIYSGNAQNIALIPTSPTLPITINNVNNGTANAGPCEYCAYYVNNGTGTTPLANPSIQYDGFTTPLRAYAPLQCGQVYHIKLAVGNVSDNLYDSAVFLKNFTIQPLELQVTDLSGTPSIPLCFGTINSINSGLPASGTNVYQWSFEGVLVPGETSPNFPAVPASPPVALTPGTYTLNVYTPTGCLLATDDIEISYRPEAPIQEPLDITLCTAAAPPYTVNIDQTTTILGALDPDLYEVSFYDTNLADAMAGGVAGLIPFANWANYSITSVPTTIWANVLDLLTDCKTVRPFEINVTPTPSGTISFPELSYCTDVTTTPITTNVTPGGIYSATPPGLTIDPATGAINPSTSTPNNYTIHYDLAASGTCPAYSAPTIPLTVALIPATPTITVVQPSCTVTTGSITVTAPLGIDLEYSMDNGVTYQSSPVFNTVPSGYNYQILVRNTTSNCASAALAGTMNPVLGVPLPATASVTVQPDCVTPTGTIIVSSPTGANLEYSINGGTSYQSSTSFAGLTPNVTYNITVRDVNTGCLSAATPFTINPLPASPASPAGNITQPTCFVPTATIALTSPIGTDLEYSIDGGTTYLPWVNFPWLTPNATYSISVRNTTTSCISPTTVFVVNAIPANPTTPTGTLVQPTCSVTTGSYVITSPQGTDLQYSLDGGTTYQSGLSFPSLTANTSYSLTAYNSVTGCTSAATTVNINPILSVPASATASTTVQPTCTVPTGTIVVTAPLGTDLEYSANGGTTYQASATFAGLAPNASYSIVVRNTVSGCTSAPVSVSVDPLPAGPAAPTASVTVQPDCITPTGTIVVSSPTGANVEYSINGGTSYQSSATFAGLTPNVTYNITVRDVTTGCISAASPYTVNALPASPASPAGNITQPTCFVPTATIALTSPIGTDLEYSIDGGTTYLPWVNFPWLTPNATYSISVRNTTTSCISPTTVFVVNAIPANPTTPTGTLVQPTCSVTTGSYVITSPQGTDLQYSLDGGTTYQSGLSFPSLTANTSYSLTAYNSVTGCTSAATTVNINPILAVPASATASTTVQPICTVPTGTIVVTAPLGTDLEYSANGGTTYQASATFAGLAPNASYSIVVRNTVSGCTSAPVSVSVDPLPAGPAAPTASVTVQPDCITPTGTIVVSSPTGANVEYSINGGTSYQSSTSFAGLAPNTSFNISVRDVVTRCISTATAVLVSPIPANPVAPLGSITQPICANPTGTIVLTSPLGATFEYSIDGGTTYQAGLIFAGLAPNATYSISVRNITTSCVSNATVFVVNAIPANPTAPAGTLVQPTCSVTTGSYVITSPQGTDLQYSLDGGTTYQSGLSFPTLTANTSYSLTAYNSVTGCTSAATTVNINPILSVPASATASTTVQPICTVPTGTIVVTAPLGTDLEYSANAGTTYQASATFAGLAPNASYSIVVRNTVSGCTSAPVSVSVDPLPAGPAAPTASVTVQPDCITPTGTIVVSSPTGTNFEYSINGGTSYQSSTSFAGLAPNTSFNISVRDVVTRCISTATAVLVSPIPANPVAPLGSITQPICANPTGTIVLTSPLGATFQYSIDGGTTYQSGVTFAGLAPNATYTIRVRNTVSGCVSLGSNFVVIPAPNVPATPLASANVACVGESIYFTTPTVPGATYSWTGPNGYTSSFQNPVILSAQLDLIGTYQVVVALTPDCPSLPGSVTLSVNPLPVVQITGGAICVDGSGAVLSPLQLDTTLSTTDFTFQWFTIANNSATLIPGSAPTYLASTPAEYGVVVTDLISGCVSNLASAEVTLMPKPESLVLETSAYFSDAQVIYAYVLPLGNYEYQLDGGNFQSSNVFGGVSTGTHTVTVRDLNQCGELSETVELLDFPRFFTPNGDTYNDTWNIFELRNQANAKIYIFDRLGKLLKQLSPADPGWDGTFNNKDLPASDYWFVVYYKEKNEDKIFKSHFALKR